MSKTNLLNELRAMEPDTVLYGLLASFLAEEREEAIASLEVLLEKMRSDAPLLCTEVVDVLTSVLDELAEAGYFPDQEEEDAEEYGIEFDIVALKDDDPKKRLN